MLSLSINTSSQPESVSLFSGKHLLKQICWRGNMDETQKLLPAILRLLHSAKAKFSDLNRIIVDCGPGSFSSLRIGVTIANTLAFALKIPLYEKVGEKLRKVKIATPRYSKPPNITKSKIPQFVNK